MSDEPATPRRMRGWRVEATCPECGGVLQHVADGRPSATEVRAVARCSSCGRDWVAALMLLRASEVVPRPRADTRPDRLDLVHGTRHGYGRGCRCHACRNAEAVYQRARRERTRVPA